MIMMKAVFWDVAPCGYSVNRRFGGKYHLTYATLAHPGSIADLFLSATLKMEAIRSSETSVNTISTRCHIPEDCFLHSQ
jgi:hypothetical protein